MKRNILRALLLAMVALMTIHQQLHAQQLLDNSMSQYFRNRMLWNPAYTGVDGDKISAMQNQSWIGFEGAPVLTNFNGEYNFGMNSAAAMQLVSDKPGLLIKTLSALSYAYRIRFDADTAQWLRLGVSLGLHMDRINTQLLGDGGIVDPVIESNINNQYKWDGNFGAVYRNNKLEFGLALYRLWTNLKGGDSLANLSIAQFSASYLFDLSGDQNVLIKPIAMLHAYRNTPMILDIGAQFEYAKTFNVMGVYQSVGNLRAGVGLRNEKFGEANFFFNSNTRMTNVSSQQYEVAVGIYLKRRY